MMFENINRGAGISTDEDRLLQQMQWDFEKVSLSKDQKLKQILHPREDAHKLLDKQQATGYNFYNDSNDTGQGVKENTYKEEFIKQLKLIDPQT